MLDTHLQFKVVPYQLLLLSSQVLQLGLIVADLLPHHTGGVAAKSLPLSRQFSAFLSVIIKKAAEVPQLLIILGQPGVQVFQAANLILKICHLLGDKIVKQFKLFSETCMQLFQNVTRLLVNASNVNSGKT